MVDGYDLQHFQRHLRQDAFVDWLSGPLRSAHWETTTSQEKSQLYETSSKAILAAGRSGRQGGRVAQSAGCQGRAEVHRVYSSRMPPRLQCRSERSISGRLSSSRPYSLVENATEEPAPLRAYPRNMSALASPGQLDLPSARHKGSVHP
jgi:hypothetical protein